MALVFGRCGCGVVGVGWGGGGGGGSLHYTHYLVSDPLGLLEGYGGGEAVQI